MSITIVYTCTRAKDTFFLTLTFSLRYLMDEKIWSAWKSLNP